MSTKTHRESYPEQYTHPLVGKLVEAPDGTRFTVERIVGSRFGQLAPLPGDGFKTAYAITTLKEIEQ